MQMLTTKKILHPGLSKEWGVDMGGGGRAGVWCNLWLCCNIGLPPCFDRLLEIMQVQNFLALTGGNWQK